MHRTARLLLLAGAAPLLSLPSAASAACARAVCLDVPLPGSVSVGPSVGSDGSGVLCAYVKLAGSPPHGWGGGSGAPYFWVETQRWGAQYPDDWDLQACAPLCPTATNPAGTELCLSVEIGPPR
jgi:hypothetical protein